MSCPARDRILAGGQTRARQKSAHRAAPALIGLFAVGEVLLNIERMKPADARAQPAWPDSPAWPPPEFRQKRGPYAQYAKPADLLPGAGW